jgi:hypothetical protein
MRGLPSVFQSADPVHRADPDLWFWPIGTFRRVFYPANHPGPPLFRRIPRRTRPLPPPDYPIAAKNAEFAAAVQSSGYTSPAAALGRKFETG